MAGDYGVGQQLAVDGDVSAELFEYGIGIDQPAAETGRPHKAAGNGQMGGQVFRLQGNAAGGGFES